jgi:hypothetical protein
VVGSAEVDRWCDRLHHLAEELRAETLTASGPDVLARVDAARDACEWITGDLDDIARRAGLAGMLPDVSIEPSDAAEAARVLRAVLAEIADPESELGASPAMRNRIEGAAVSFESLAGVPDAVVTSKEAMGATGLHAGDGG